MGLDFAAPVTPGDVLREMASQYEWHAKDERRQSEEHAAAAKVWDQAARQAQADARSYDQWQPKPAEPTEPVR